MPNPSEPWHEEYMTLIDDCEKRESKMTEWERTFVDTLKSRVQSGSRPSPRQAETLETIWNKVTS